MAGENSLPNTKEAGRKPSFVVGTLHSGTWMNTVADASEFWFVRRLIPEESVQDARDEILQILQDARKDDPTLDCSYSEHYATPSSVGSTEDELATALSGAANRVRGRKPSFVLGAATFDIRFTLQAGIPSLNYGPGRLELAHTTDEWLEMAELNDSIAVLALATAKLLRLIDCD